MAAKIRVGVGGWTFPPWRGVFYPEGLKQKEELSFASRQLSAIEINGTYRSLQKPASFAAWAAQTPDGFVFTVKGSMYCANKKVLAEAGPGLERFFGQGLSELGAKLGPVLWQFMPFRRFDPEDFAAFLDLLPTTLADAPLRQCVEVRHRSFVDDRFYEMCARRKVAICLSDEERWPLIDQPTADFTYARLMRGSNETPTGYELAEIEAWAERFQKDAAAGREVFAFFIHGGKTQAPAAAKALMERV